MMFLILAGSRILLQMIYFTFLGRRIQTSLAFDKRPLGDLLQISIFVRLHPPQRILRSLSCRVIHQFTRIPSWSLFWNPSLWLKVCRGGKKILDLPNKVFERAQFSFKETPLFVVPEHHSKLSLGNTAAISQVCLGVRDYMLDCRQLE